MKSLLRPDRKLVKWVLLVLTLFLSCQQLLGPRSLLADTPIPVRSLKSHHLDATWLSVMFLWSPILSTLCLISRPLLPSNCSTLSPKALIRIYSKSLFSSFSTLRIPSLLCITVYYKNNIDLEIRANLEDRKKRLNLDPSSVTQDSWEVRAPKRPLISGRYCNSFNFYGCIGSKFLLNNGYALQHICNT